MAALVIAVIYPFLKRVVPVSVQAWLGLAFGFSIPMAYAPRPGRAGHRLVLLLAHVFWSIAYDTEYAMVDRDDDVRIGVKSSAILLDRYDVAGVKASQALFLGLLAYVGAARRCACRISPDWALPSCWRLISNRLLRDREREACFRAFLNNNWLGFVYSWGPPSIIYFRMR